MKKLFIRKFYLPICLGINLAGVSLYKGTFVNNATLIFPLICVGVLFLFFIGEKLFREKRKKDFIEPDSLFFIVFFVFHFPYVALFTMGLSGYDNEVFFNPDTVPKAVYFCLFCLIAFLAGYGNPVGSEKQFKLVDRRHMLEWTLISSKVLIIICVLFFWLPLLVLGNAVFSDYRLIIDVGAASNLGKLFWLEQYLGVAALSLYCICSGLLHKKFMSGPFKYLAIFYVISFAIIGDRGGFVSMGIIPLIAFNIFQKKISGKALASIILIFMLIIPVIAFSRTRSIFNPMQMIRSYSAQHSESIIISALNELGTTIKTVAITMHYVPDKYEYWWGSSYAFSLSLVVPNIHGMRISAGTPGAWLTETAFGDLSKTHGRGGSIAMEAYRNFGFILGPGVFFLLGLALKKAYGRFLYQPDVFSGVVYFSTISAVVLWIRNDSSLVPRTIIWSIVITIVIILMAKMMPRGNKS